MWRPALIGFDGRPLAATSQALEARCQTAVADAVMRARERQPPPVYVDVLEGVRVAPLNGTDDVRIVYLIGVGSRPTAHLVVSRLLYALYSPTHLFLIHLDVKAAAAAADACYALQRSHPNVKVLSARRLVQWGMFSMVSIAVDAIHTAVAAAERSDASTQLHFDFFINLSDADLALRTDSEMRGFLRRMRGRSLINIHDGGGGQLQAAAKFINDHTIVECGGYGFVVANHTPSSFPLTHECCIGRSGPAAFASELPLATHPLLRQPSRVHTGSQWVVLSYSFCADLLVHGKLAEHWLSAFERRLVPDESFFQTVAMASPRHRRSLVNHNMRWIDWPHSHGDPNEYWQRLGARQYVGGPRVLNSSELQPVLSSPYMFARKVDVEVDADVLRLWDTWMARKLSAGGGAAGGGGAGGGGAGGGGAGGGGADGGGSVASSARGGWGSAMPGGRPVVDSSPLAPPQSPIGHSPGDPMLSIRFRAPGAALESARSAEQTRRRIARISFADGSHCGCGDACGALPGGCCSHSMCGVATRSTGRGSGSAQAGGGSTQSSSSSSRQTQPQQQTTPGGEEAREKAIEEDGISHGAGHGAGYEDSEVDELYDEDESGGSDGSGEAVSVVPACPTPSPHAASEPGGAPLVVSWINRARHPIALSVLDFRGSEIPMRTLKRRDDTAAFHSHAKLMWRVRNLGGELLMETVPSPPVEGAEQGGAGTLGAGTLGAATDLDVDASGGAAAATSMVTVAECRLRYTGAAFLLARGEL